MTHINYTRQAENRFTCRLSDFLPAQERGSSFAAFCGTPEDRQAAVLRGAARCCGHSAVILLHDSPAMAARLGEMYGMSDLPFQAYSISAQNRVYDPLYGMDREGVLDAILPLDPFGAAAPTLIEQRGALSDYLQIMELQFSNNRAAFGDYPYSLDLLLALTAMPAPQLESRVLRYLHDAAPGLSARMTADGVQLRAYHAVSNFARLMGSGLYTQQSDWRRHTRLSISSAIARRQVLAIHAPSSRPELLRCLAVELSAMERRGIPFLLVCCDIRLQACSQLENLFLTPSSYCSTGLALASPQGMLSTEQFPSLLARHDQVIVFPCRNASEAEIFSAALGSYYRVYYPEHRETHRGFFDILPDYTRGRGYAEEVVRNVRPEELTGGATLLFGRNTPIPILASRIIY